NCGSRTPPPATFCPSTAGMPAATAELRGSGVAETLFAHALGDRPSFFTVRPKFRQSPRFSRRVTLPVFFVHPSQAMSAGAVLIHIPGATLLGLYGASPFAVDRQHWSTSRYRKFSRKKKRTILPFSCTMKAWGNAPGE